MMPYEYYSNYNTCIFSDDFIAIQKAIISVLEKEGGRISRQLPSSKNRLAVENPWIIGWFPAEHGWTIIKTYPAELLCVSTSDNSHPLLSALAIKLKCNAFYLGVYQSFNGILLEANAEGEVHITGNCNAQVQVESFYDQPINKKGTIEDFSLLKVPQSLKSAVQINQHPIIVQRNDRHSHMSWLYEPPLGYEDLDNYEDMKGHTQKIDEAFFSIIDTYGIWAYSSLPYIIYTDYDILLASKGHLLCLQSPSNFIHPQPYKLSRNQWLEVYGIEPPLDS